MPIAANDRQFGCGRKQPRVRAEPYAAVSDGLVGVADIEIGRYSFRASVQTGNIQRLLFHAERARICRTCRFPVCSQGVPAVQNRNMEIEPMQCTLIARFDARALHCRGRYHEQVEEPGGEVAVADCARADPGLERL